MSKDDRFLHQKAREAIRSGRFPNRAPDQVWGGPGTGAECAVCGEATTHEDVELEIEYDRGDSARVRTYLVHLRCYSLLELERQAASARGGFAKAQQTKSPAASSMDAMLKRPNGG